MHVVMCTSRYSTLIIYAILQGNLEEIRCGSMEHKVIRLQLKSYRLISPAISSVLLVTGMYSFTDSNTNRQLAGL